MSQPEPVALRLLRELWETVDPDVYVDEFAAEIRAALTSAPPARLDALGRDYSIDFDAPAAQDMLRREEAMMDAGFFIEEGTEDGEAKTRIITAAGTYDISHLLAHARREALEEAARVCDAEEFREPGYVFASRIRALIEPAQVAGRGTHMQSYDPTTGRLIEPDE